MAPHSSVLARRIPGTGERGGLPSLGSHRVGHDWRDLAAAELVAEERSLDMVVRKVLSEEVTVAEDTLQKENKEDFLRKQRVFEAWGRKEIGMFKNQSKANVVRDAQ